MKRVFLRKCIICLTALILLHLIPLTGLADHITENENGVTVVCNSAVPGTQTAFMAVLGTEENWSLSAENLLFIRQLTADGDGCVRIAYLGNPEQDAVFVMGGTFIDNVSPRIIGSAARYPVRFPERLTAIGEEAFLGSDLQAVYLTDGMTAIGARAFKDCKSLVYIRIPDTVVEIADDAFDRCGSLVIGCGRSSAALSYAATHEIRVEITD